MGHHAHARAFGSGVSGGNNHSNGQTVHRLTQSTKEVPEVSGIQGSSTNGLGTIDHAIATHRKDKVNLLLATVDDAMIDQITGRLIVIAYELEYLKARPIQRALNAI